MSFIDNLTDESRIADIGCGTGGQTMVLAQQAQGMITGIDLFPTFIDLFNSNAARLNLQESVVGVVARWISWLFRMKNWTWSGPKEQYITSVLNED